MLCLAALQVSVEDPFDAAENCARTLGVRQMAAKDRTLQKVVDLFHWTEDGLRELGPTTGACFHSHDACHPIYPCGRHSRQDNTECIL